MTRQRYIKLVMAMGVPRNVAARGAAHARKHGVPYAADLEMLKFIRGKITEKVMDKMEQAILYGTGPAPLGIINPIKLEIIPQKPATEYQLRMRPTFGPVLDSRALVRINKITEVSLVPSGGYPIGGASHE